MNEFIIQQTSVKLIKEYYPELVFNLSLNGISLKGLSSSKIASIIADMKKQGMETGIQDLSLYLPKGKILNLEFKTEKGKQSEAQIKIEQKLKNLEHNYFIVKTPYEVLDLIIEHTSEQFRTSSYLINKNVLNLSNKELIKIYGNIKQLS